MPKISCFWAFSNSFCFSGSFFEMNLKRSDPLKTNISRNAQARALHIMGHVTLVLPTRLSAATDNVMRRGPAQSVKSEAGSTTPPAEPGSRRPGGAGGRSGWAPSGAPQAPRCVYDVALTCNGWPPACVWGRRAASKYYHSYTHSST